MAVTASFSPAAKLLSVFGDSLSNNTIITRDAERELLVNGGAVKILGGTCTVANTSLSQMYGLAGDDFLKLDETNGARPKANLFGGLGNDTLTGGSGGDMLFGQGD